MRYFSKPLMFIILFNLGLCASFPTWAAQEQNLQEKDRAENSSTRQPNKPPMQDIQRFTTAINYIKNYYVHPVKDSTLFENAIRGMVDNLDPHSAYLDTEDFKELNEATKGEFGGLGLEVTMEDGVIKVVTPIDDTPAAKANIKPQDKIILIDDKPVKGMSLRDAVTKMRGAQGSKIKLTIIRENERKPIVVVLTRAIIHVQSVRSQLLEGKFGYVRIASFQANTEADLLKGIEELKKQLNDRPLAGLILDLRNDPGGLLDAAVQVADTFLNRKLHKKDNIIVYTKGRIPGSEFTAYANNGDLLNGAPMVVLINEGSASGSEIVAGALQDHRRALIVGTRSFGKGSVQSVLPLDDKHAIKLTTALYYTPLGRSIQAEGIEPDIVVRNVTVSKDDNNKDNQIKAITEATLLKHIENGQTGSVKQKNNVIQVSEQDLIYKDFQLYQALNLLNGLSKAREELMGSSK